MKYAFSGESIVWHMVSSAAPASFLSAWVTPASVSGEKPSSLGWVFSLTVAISAPYPAIRACVSAICFGKPLLMASSSAYF